MGSWEFILGLRLVRICRGGISRWVKGVLSSALVDDLYHIWYKKQLATVGQLAHVGHICTFVCLTLNLKMTMSTNNVVIRLTADGYSDQLDRLSKDDIISDSLAVLLADLIGRKCLEDLAIRAGSKRELPVTDLPLFSVQLEADIAKKMGVGNFLFNGQGFQLCRVRRPRSSSESRVEHPGWFQMMPTGCPDCIFETIHPSC